ncbi:MAG: N-acetylneuraminate synthase family protein, partial [Campylobacterota bacterium]
TFGVTVGFSDHTLGITAPVTAVSLGARVLEKHFIIDKALGGPDAKFSLDVSEFKAMVQSVRECEKLLGEVVYNDKSKPSRRFARSLYVSAPIKKAERFSKDNIKSVRPGYGLHPKYLEEILGQKADRQYQPGDRLVLEGKEATYEA